MEPDQTDPLLRKSSEFSVVLGGPFFRLLRLTGLSGGDLERLTRRSVILALFAWMPLLILSAIEGNAWGGNLEMPFLLDVDVHARLLLALPIFLAAEVLVHRRMHLGVEQFVSSGLVPDNERGRFETAISSAERLRNSVTAEVLILAFVCGVGVLVIWRNYGTIQATTWIRETVDGRTKPTLAGWWFGCVGMPLIQFLLIRWYFRVFIWARFLWQVSRIDLRLLATHPDRAGGLGFLSVINYCFVPLLLGQMVLLVGVMANMIFHEGSRLSDFKLELLLWVALILFLLLVPMLVFVPILARTKRTAILQYGVFAQRYVRGFDGKWLHGDPPTDEPLLGSADVQSLADLGNSYEVVKGMKLVPFGKELVLHLALLSLLPVVPVVLAMIPLNDLLDRFVEVFT